MSESRPPRRAPDRYERLVPTVLVAVVVIIILLILITLAVLLGLWPQ